MGGGGFEYGPDTVKVSSSIKLVGRFKANEDIRELAEDIADSVEQLTKDGGYESEQPCFVELVVVVSPKPRPLRNPNTGELGGGGGPDD